MVRGLSGGHPVRASNKSWAGTPTEVLFDELTDRIALGGAGLIAVMAKRRRRHAADSGA